MSTRLRGAVDAIDVRIERIARLIDTGAAIDRELAAGLACKASMTSIQSDIDVALATVDRLQKAIRDDGKRKK
jgi:hypothetical protein